MDALFTPESRRFALAVLALAVASLAEAQAPADPIEVAGYIDPSVAQAVSRARSAVLKKLRAPRCRRVFSEFKTLSGQTLDEVLTSRDETPEHHFHRMTFLDGSHVPPCGRRDVYAFTEPGNLTIQLCTNFRKLARLNPASAANLLIHEMLHSLGAGEAPSPGLPTAYEITIRVEFLCGS